MVGMSDPALAAARPFSAAVRLSPAACAGPEAHRRYCTRHPGAAADAGGPTPVVAGAVGLWLGPADAAELPPEPQAVRASPAASAAPATMGLPGIGGVPSRGADEQPRDSASRSPGSLPGGPGRSPAYCTGRQRARLAVRRGPADADAGRTGELTHVLRPAPAGCAPVPPA